jgi:hypothetical protein
MANILLVLKDKGVQEFKGKWHLSEGVGFIKLHNPFEKRTLYYPTHRVEMAEYDYSDPDTD